MLPTAIRSDRYLLEWKHEPWDYQQITHCREQNLSFWKKDCVDVSSYPREGHSEVSKALVSKLYRTVDIHPLPPYNTVCHLRVIKKNVYMSNKFAKVMTVITVSGTCVWNSVKSRAHLVMFERDTTARSTYLFPILSLKVLVMTIDALWHF